MASPELAIARAALSATLFRADPTSLSRPAAESLFPLVAAAVSQCSRPNVQKCKAWILDYVVPSAQRAAALGRYLLALSRSLVDDGQRPSLKRRRLHVLYVVSDVLHHAATRGGNRSLEAAWASTLPGLVASAAAFERCPKHKKKLSNLIDLWDERSYLSSGLISKLREAFESGAAVQPTAGPTPSAASIKLAKETPYILPSFHGDPSAPWYDLPAATWFPHLTPNSAKPLLPDLVRPIQLAPGPADKALATAVQDLLSYAERLFSKEQKWEDEPHVDINELGERVILDEVTGDVIGGETYYGWSREFCEKMKERGRKSAMGHSRGRSLSQSSGFSRGRSRSSSGPAPKRRRRSPDSRSRSRRRDSYSSGGSPDNAHSRLRRRSRGRSPDRSRSRSADRRRYSRSPLAPSSRPPQRRDMPQQQQHTYPPPPAFPPIPAPGDLPPPPPPPVGYQGPWPPPPPPPPQMGGMPQNWIPPPGLMPQIMGGGGWGSVPVPVPPPPMAPAHQANFGPRNGGPRGRGRGGGGGYGWGRGGR